MAARPSIELLDFGLDEGRRIADKMLSLDQHRPFSSTDFISQVEIKVLIIHVGSSARGRSHHVGFCTLNQGQTYAELARLYVMPEERRGGIGEASMLELFKYLAPLGLRSFHIQARDPDALRFWQAATESLELEVSGGEYSDRWVIYGPGVCAPG